MFLRRRCLIVRHFIESIAPDGLDKRSFPGKEIRDWQGTETQAYSTALKLHVSRTGRWWMKTIRDPLTANNTVSGSHSLNAATVPGSRGCRDIHRALVLS